jgi:signal transduction histidine kinase
MRLRDRRFWIVQILVLGISIGHSLLEARLIPGLPSGLYLVPAAAYFIPVVYAALNFGVEGAVPTALWSAVLVAPNLALWHSPAQRPGVVLELVILVVIAYVIAQRVDAETAAKERAEAATARLERLNQTAAASAKSLELESVLSRTLQAMLDPKKNQTGWVMLAADGTDPEIVQVASAPGGRAEIGAHELAASRSVAAEPAAASDARTVHEPRLAIVPIRASGRRAGAIGLASSSENVSAGDARLLEAVASQLGVALDNIRHLRQATLMVSDLSDAQRALQEYVRLATDAQEDERKRLARELHDGTIQALVTAKAELDALTAVGKPVAGPVRDRLARVEAVLTAAIDDVRRFSRDLRPSLLDDLGLVEAIDWLVGDLGTRAGIDAQLRVTGEPRRLGQREELALFRIVQEALRNVERHAQATFVEVHMDFDEDVRVTVLDNGTGFEISDVLGDRGASTRLGLRGMRERAKLVGAHLSIKSAPQSGTEVAVLLPPQTQ